MEIGGLVQAVQTEVKVVDSNLAYKEALFVLSNVFVWGLSVN
jgi:hypothetical protein